MKRKNHNLFWGFALIIFAVILILSQMGFLGSFKIGVWTLLATVFLLAVLLKSLFCLNFSGILFPIAFLCILYDEPLGITAITPWTVLIAALLGSIGLSLIFRPKKRHRASSHTSFSYRSVSGESDRIIDDADGDSFICKCHFGSCIKYVNSSSFTDGVIDCSFGGIKLYFDSTVIAGEYAELDIDCSFGGIELYVPKEWTVTDQMHVFLGGIEEKNPQTHCGGGKGVILKGNLKFSCINITYI